MSIRILVVEDDTAIADFLIRGLQEEGYGVSHAADGDEGRRRLQTESWDVVLLDCWLPKTDRLTVLRQFPQEGGVAPVPLLNARDAVADRVRGLDIGDAGYLWQPVTAA